MDGSLTVPATTRPSAEQLLTLVIACCKELPLLLRATAWDANAKERGRLLCEASILVVGGPSTTDTLVGMLAATGAAVRAAPDLANALPLFPGTDVVVLDSATSDGETPAATRMDRDVLGRLPSGSVVVDATGFAMLDPDALVLSVEDGTVASAAVVIASGATLPADHAVRTLPQVALVPIG